MTQEQLPAWVKVSSRCWYFSESQKTLHPVVVTSIDVTKRRIVVHFEANHSIWKTIPFDLAGRNGSLRPPDAGQLEDRNGLTSTEKKDGTSTPPWYDTLVMRSTHERDQLRAKDDEKKKAEELLAQQERRRYAWEEEKRRQQEERQQAREMERIRIEEEAEASRILIVQKLQREREEEMRRQQEAHWMEAADEACGKVNMVWRQRERVRRRQEEEERQAEEDEAQRLAEEQYQKDLAARPRVSFGVKTKPEPARLHIPQHTSTSYSQDLARNDGINGSSYNRRLNDEYPHDASGMSDAEGFPDDEFMSAEEADLGHEQDPPARSRWADNGTAHEQYELPDPPPGEWGERPPDSSDTPSRMMVEPPQEEYSTAEDWYHARVRAIYKLHNPSKLTEVPSLLEKYSDCQAEMYNRICKKYGVQPETMPSFLQMTPEIATGARSRSRHRREPLLPGITPKASAPSPSVGYARKASAPPPPQPAKPVRVAPSRAPGIPAPSSSPSADTSTSTLRARLDSLISRKKEENDHDAPRGRDGFASHDPEATSWQEQPPPPPRDDIVEGRRGRSDSRPCHREERWKASSRPVLTPRPPPGIPPPIARNGSDWRRGRDDSKNRQREHRKEEFHRRRSESRCNRDHCEWEERRDERTSRGRSYDEHPHDRRRGERVQLHRAPPDWNRSIGGNDMRAEPPWREERRSREHWQAADSRSTNHRGPCDGGHRSSRRYGGY